MIPGGHVLVVEDEYIIAAEIELFFLEAGADRVTIVGYLDHPALEPAKLSAYSLAVMELQVHGASTTGLARGLIDVGVPVVFCTVCTEFREGVPWIADVPVVAKPCAPNDIYRTIMLAAQAKAPRGDQLGNARDVSGADVASGP